ncbi:MAG: hypothetical protein A3A44_03045 [Candidatus Sungbacteria bacterium RIFCSPLOWO2_01_FULL_60_25]|uniref:Probable transcriptional regulatory protein A3A44_03045 n=1 Tax=Candidatus Sungbacteria bacterium RIFCSPLOWO2_01_FULL_60_25 TaxID=1802281 RepID=A0A1G2L9P1_9BACT|nr:MAG: hypothetical protein A3A44_03045 [Candidatus Sungbacteria bacterium RIFCSPLOWO2_01_FULL_60_25]
MSGHSKWAQIKHQKAGTDAKRGALFSKLARIVTVAARDGGANPDMNAKLRQAVEQAREAGVPKDNIERAILRATGSGADAAALRAFEYEAYGPGGSAFLVAGLTDSPNRTTNEIKRILEERGGRLAASGSVLWMFERKVAFALPLPPTERRDELELALIDSGADAIEADANALHVLVPPERAARFAERLGARGIAPLRSSLIALPKTSVPLGPTDAASAAALAAALEEQDDVTGVSTNVRE